MCHIACGIALAHDYLDPLKIFSGSQLLIACSKLIGFSVFFRYLECFRNRIGSCCISNYNIGIVFGNKQVLGGSPQNI